MKLARAVIVLFALSLVMSAGTYLAATHYYHAEQAAQRRQGAVLEQRLCITLGRLAALKPPPGNPAANPSRAFEDEQHAVLAQLGPDVGCKGTR
jgi:hypothetical protein